jgi:hypothetical protein
MNKKTQNKVDWKVICTGLVCLTVAELYALNQGINGTIFTLYVAILAGAIGVFVPNPLKK